MDSDKFCTWDMMPREILDVNNRIAKFIYGMGCVTSSTSFNLNSAQSGIPYLES